MKQRTARIFLLGMLATCLVHAGPPESLPIPVERFCAIHFPKGKELGIALEGQPFNSTDLVDADKPMRRIIGYSVAKNVSWLWYEHGGYAPHQHLLSFYNQDPATVTAAYTFSGNYRKHDHIDELIQDITYLEANRSTHPEF